MKWREKKGEVRIEKVRKVKHNEDMIDYWWSEDARGVPIRHPPNNQTYLAVRHNVSVLTCVLVKCALGGRRWSLDAQSAHFVNEQNY